MRAPPAATIAVPATAALAIPAPPSASAARSPPPRGMKLIRCSIQIASLPAPPTCPAEIAGSGRNAATAARWNSRAAHLAAQLTVDPPARDAGAHMSSREARLMLVCRSRRVGGNRSGAELTHAPCGGDGGDAIELEVGAASRRTHLSQREPQQARGRDGADPVARHHRDDLTLARVEVGHQVGGTGEPVAQLKRIEGVGSVGRLLSRQVELDALPRAKAGEVPAFAVAAAAVVDREPERAHQVVFVGDTARSHHDSGDRIVDDLLLRAGGDATCLAAAAQLSDQPSATPVQLRGRLLRRPGAVALPRADHARPPRARTQDGDPPEGCRKPLIHE